MGFFYNDTGEKKKTSHGKGMQIELMHKQKCKACPRNHDKKLTTPKMEPAGANGKKCEIYIIGSAPTNEDDTEGLHFTGKSGQYLADQIPGRYRRKTRWNNMIRCSPPKDRNPLPQETECCRMLQEEDIAKHKPEVIVLAGFLPMSWLFGISTPGIGAWRGRLVPVRVQGHTCWAYTVLAPSDVLRKAGGRKYRTDEQQVFERDFRTLFRLIRKGLPEVEVFDGYEGAEVKCFYKGTRKDLEAIRTELHAMMKEKICGVDIETKNLRPYKTDSKILTCSVTTKKRGTIVFPVSKTGAWKSKALQKQMEELLCEFVASPIKKVCHNTKFEQEWFAFHYGMDTILETNWADTMAMGYALDSRKKMLNLGVMTFLEFGFNVKELSDIDTKGDLDGHDLHELLKYNGLDSKWTLALYWKLLKKVKREKLLGVVKERVRTGATLVGAQLKGVPVHQPTADKLSKKLDRLMAKELRRARKTKAWSKFVNRVGRDPNPDSHPDMVELFDKIMHVEACKTPSGGITTGDDVLSKLSPKRYPVASIICEMRSIATVKSTYVTSLPKLVYPDGLLHTSYSHLYTTSSRLNSQDPNLQNWPKHKWKIIRKIIQSLTDGVHVMSFDYAQIEARVIAMASQDDAFIKMLWDKYDVHMEWATRIHDEYKGCLDAIGIDKKWSDGGDRLYRQEVKNKWVFPLFFGANERNVSGGLNLPEDVTAYLYREFWSVFEGIQDWQAELVNSYNKKGYVETLTGFRRYAPCSYNEIINHPVQGTACAIISDASTRLQDKGIQFNMNMHDDLTFMMQNKAKQIRQIAKEMCRPAHDFINVPLVVEVEGGPNWYDQETIGEFSSNEDFGYH